MRLNKHYSFFALIEKLIRDSINTQTYRKKANILKNVMADYKIPKHFGDIMVLDASCTAHYLLKKTILKLSIPSRAKKNVGNATMMKQYHIQ